MKDSLQEIFLLRDEFSDGNNMSFVLNEDNSQYSSLSNSLSFLYADSLLPVAAINLSYEIVFSNKAFRDILTGLKEGVDEFLSKLSILVSDVIGQIKNMDLENDIYPKMPQAVTNLGSAEFKFSFVPKKINEDETVLLVHLVDISDLVDVIDIGQEKNEKLSNENTVKNKIFSIIAHDLKNPISTIEQVSKVLSSEYQIFSDEDRKEYIEDIHRTSKTTSSLLETLLEWAHVQKGTAQYEPQFTDLYLIGKKCEELTSIKARQKNINFSMAIPERTYSHCDPRMVYTIFRNLIINSLKFTNNGGEVSLRLIEVKNGFITIGVFDNGVGMNPEKSQNLFSMDSVASSTMGTNMEKGTGLGLILSRDFVSMHGGKIWVESEEKIGTKIFFTLPIAQE
ncbi:MAG: hypothetical protein Kapaf2KO_12680 [Candidatus Kapaibacteriales bacterium]